MARLVGASPSATILFRRCPRSIQPAIKRSSHPAPPARAHVYLSAGLPAFLPVKLSGADDFIVLSFSLEMVFNG